MFFSKGFIVSDLTFRSLMHFEFIFVYGVRKSSSFLAPLIEETVFSPFYIIVSFVVDSLIIGA